MTAPTETTTSVTVTRTISADVERVYRAFTHSDDLNNWFCNRSLLQVAENSPYLMIWTAEGYSASGVFKTVEPNQKLSLTWRGVMQGQAEPAESLMTITFDGQDGATTVTLHHDGLLASHAEGYEHQWNSRMDDLKTYVETGAIAHIINHVIIGIYPGPVSQERADELGIDPAHGTYVGNVIAGYGADKAGIQAGDVIVGIDGEALVPPRHMGNAVQGKRPGDEVSVELYRGADKLTLTMPLSAYPVPETPANHAELAERIAGQHAGIFAELDELLSDVSEAEADAYPAEGEWNLKQIIAHLLYSERFAHNQLGASHEGQQPHYWSGNQTERLTTLATSYETFSGLMTEFRRACAETVTLLRDLPNKQHDLWQHTFNLHQWVQHIESHMPQLRETLAAARKS